MKNERTSKRVSAIAGKIMRNIQHVRTGPSQYNPVYMYYPASSANETLICTIGDLKALAASALTQTPDKPKKARS